MPTDHTASVLSNVFGTLGAVCWSIQLLPQILLNHRRHAASGLSPTFMLCWACAGIPLGVYNIVQRFNVALQLQPQILTTLSLITWAQCQYYERKWNLRKAAGVSLAVAALMGGVEVGLVFAVDVAVKRGVDWPATLMAVLAAVFLALGVLEQYLAIWKTKSVEGVSFLFCGLDALGDLTSIVSVCFEPKLQIVALVTYALELVLWIGVFACGTYLRFFPWIRAVMSKRSAGEEAPTINAHITLHEMPSSTSVFRTPSQTDEIRFRRPGA
ncbi:PQ loop repeat-domain-containing protein [Neohortaea acidophila]|uniref:PQ loop repeat-domain-containing protein n=1 Tax=Neohortaea acidophila TaxID=245834 RepID=A0A6A6Q2C3_9PEZI|nr:PQ loop repeat-domain-containing protein [Neohortaea acidophila]KAF2486455.1 PQ loop repeat-domain-containing protein [Neohortaea acidophila]